MLEGNNTFHHHAARLPGLSLRPGEARRASSAVPLSTTGAAVGVGRKSACGQGNKGLDKLVLVARRAASSAFHHDAVPSDASYRTAHELTLVQDKQPNHERRAGSGHKGRRERLVVRLQVSFGSAKLARVALVEEAAGAQCGRRQSLLVITILHSPRSSSLRCGATLFVLDASLSFYPSAVPRSQGSLTCSIKWPSSR